MTKRAVEERDGVHILGANPLVDHIFRLVQQHSNKRNLELESRFCLHCGPNGTRTRLPIETPAVLTSAKNPTVGVLINDFSLIKTFLEEQGARTGLAPEVSHTKDIRKGDLRETVDVKSGAVLGCCKKRRLFAVDITCPRSKYDLRIALNEELPAEADPGNKSITNVREKKRISFPVDFARVDLTEVPGPSCSTYEVECDLSLEDARNFSAVSVARLLDFSFELLAQLKR